MRMIQLFVLLRRGACLAIFMHAGLSFGAEKVVLQLRWLHQFQFAGYYAALEKGYYARAGLDVEIREAGPDRPTPLDEVLGKPARYGVGNAGLAAAYQQGKPVVALAALFQRSPNIWLARKDSGIRTLQDLATKRLMLTPGIENSEMLSVFLSEGIQPKRLNIVPSSFDIDDLVNRKVDAFNAYSTNEPYLLARRGIDYTIIDPHDYGVDFYSDVLFTSANEVRNHPERAAAFRRASLAGWDYALAHPEEIIDLIISRYSQGKSREHLQFEATATRRLMQPDLIELGHMNPKRWQRIVADYVALGLIEDKRDLDDFIYRPDSQTNWRYLKPVALGLGLTTLLALLIALALSRFNAKLKREIAQRTAAEEALRQASLDKTRFLAAASHDLRQPIQAIALYLDSLSHTQLDAAQQNLSERTLTAARTLGEMLDALLDISRLDSGNVKPAPAPVGIFEAFRQIEEGYAPLALKKDLRFMLFFPHDLVLLTDRKLFITLLRNLVDNAIKYTQRGGVLVAARRRGDHALIQVWDSGTGIAAEHLPRIFDEYYQVDNPARDRTRGVGLGLSIVRRLARVLGSEIACRSRTGRGTVFEIRVPLSPPGPAAVSPEPTFAEPRPTSPSAALSAMRSFR